MIKNIKCPAQGDSDVVIYSFTILIKYIWVALGQFSADIPKLSHWYGLLYVETTKN